jgi:prolyl-tRNA synthetase
MWQEGHTVHASVEEAQARTQQMLNVYADFCAEDLAIPVVKGRKTDKEKFAGAAATYTIEALMHDGRALQSGTSHDFGTKFAEAYGIQFTDRDNKLKFAAQTSWGLSTRIIGALIMVHGDNSGLVLPPRIAPTQIMIVPIQQKKAGVLDKAFEIRDMLVSSNFRVKVDDSDKSPGFKFADQEMRGIPVRIEIGPRDIEGGKCIIARRDSHEKIECDIASLPEKMAELLPQIQKDMYDRAAKHLEDHTYAAATWEEFLRLFTEKSGFVKAMWCGDQACEDKIKEDLGVTSRCMPFKQENISDVCVCCGKPAKKMVYWGRAY